MRFFYSKVCLLILSVFAVGCNDEENTVSVSPSLRLSAYIDNFDGSAPAHLKGGEAVGLWIASETPQSLEQADVVVHGKFYQSAGGLVTEPRASWGNHKALDVIGYYPYQDSFAQTPEHVSFQVCRDQSVPDSVVASDLLWTKNHVERPVDEETAVQLPFSHLGTKLLINVRGSHPEIGSFRNSTVNIIGAKPAASVNLLTGVMTAEGTAESVKGTSLLSVAEGYEASSQVILVPQTIPAATPFLRVVTTGNVENDWAPEQDLVLEPGKQIVMDVFIEESECEVTIREITPWVSSDDVLYGEAEEDLPSYQLLDFYSRLGVEGIVVALDAGTEGKHGWLVSTDETEVAWLTDTNLKLSGFSLYDERVNLNKALAIDATLEKFPALKWCDDKNGKRTTIEDLAQTGLDGRWFLPVSNRLRDLVGNVYLGIENSTSLAALNAAIDAASLSPEKKVHFQTANWNDVESSVGYWTSSYMAFDTYDGSHLVRAVLSSTADWVGGGSGVRVTYVNGLAVQKVRAVYHF